MNLVVDAASVSAGLWFSYLFVLFYFGIAAGSVTHRDLLFEAQLNYHFLTLICHSLDFSRSRQGSFLSCMLTFFSILYCLRERPGSSTRNWMHK